jgi:mono/diheme cytochrome c family protein
MKIRLVKQLPCLIVIWAMLQSILMITPVMAKDEPAKPDPVKLAATAKDLLRNRCQECHGGNATQGDISVLDHSNLLSKKMVVPGKPDESPLYRVLLETDEDIRMPKGAPAMNPTEIDAIRQWILSGAPVYPEDVVQPQEKDKADEFKQVKGVEYVLKQILAHQRTITADDRRFVRYFSSNHLLAAGATRETLNGQRDAFAKAINHLSKEAEIVQPIVVNPETGTIFAVDIRKLGWQKQPFQVFDDKKNLGESSLNLFDLVLLEYPYAILYEDSTVYDSLLTEYMNPAGLVRPIPYVRMDWFVSVATLPPLYHDLLQLPRQLADLEKQLGVDTSANLEQKIAKRGGMTISGVSRNNRAVERHPYSLGAYWKSIDYISSKGSDNIFTDPLNLVGTGGEMIFHLPNGLQAYYVADGKGTRIDEAPTSIVTDKFAEDKTVRNGLSCIRCHDRGMKDFRDDVRPAVANLSGSGQINKREVLSQYPTHQVMNELLEQDRQRFMKAMEKVLNGPQVNEPLISVSQRFIDAPLQLNTVAGELGLSEASELKTIFKQPSFTSFGLVALGNSGVIRRDMWEDYYDQIVRNLGLGVPVVPLDGNLRSDYLPSDSKLSIKLSTDKKNNIFSPGEELVIFAQNTSASTLFIEMVGTGTNGEKIILVPAGTKLQPGQKFRFPETGSIKVKPNLGKELITVFASDKEFAAGKIIRGPNLDDRIVHGFYQSQVKAGAAQVLFDARSMVKQTIVIETR